MKFYHNSNCNEWDFIDNERCSRKLRLPWCILIFCCSHNLDLMFIFCSILNLLISLCQLSKWILSCLPFYSSCHSCLFDMSLWIILFSHESRIETLKCINLYWMGSSPLESVIRVGFFMIAYFAVRDPYSLRCHL